MTGSIKLTPYNAALLDSVCRAAGVSLKVLLTKYITPAREIPGEEVIVDDDSIVLEKMFTSTGPEEEPADLPVSDFYKDIV